MATDFHDGDGRRARGWSLPAWATAAGVLLLPALAMRVPGSGVDWTGLDFVVAAVLLGAACGAWEITRRMAQVGAARAGFAVEVLGAFALVWANLAVGLVGDGMNAANLLFMGVVAIAALGTLLARFQPAAMVRAMLATAACHALVGVTAATLGWGLPLDGAGQVLAVTALFILPWLLSAALFHRAGHQRGHGG